MATVSYPFDPSGSLASNLIQNEEQTLALSSNGYLFLVPFAGPFFKSSMKVVYYPGAKVLKEGVDYVASHYFKSASLSCAKPIYGSLTFYNKSLAGTVKLQYQTIGGEWVTTKNKALNVIANTLLNPRVAYWEQITDLPYAFPPVEHSWSLDDLVGMSSVVAELKLITNAIRSKSVGGGASTGTGNESTFDKSKYLGLNVPSVLNPRADHPEETGQVVTVVDAINHLFTYASSDKAAIVAATITPEGDTAILDLTTAAAFRVTLNAHVTHITFTNASGTAGSMRYITIVLRQGTGVNLVEWPSNIRWSYNQQPVLAYEKDYEDVVTLMNFGTDGYWYGFLAGGGFHV